MIEWTIRKIIGTKNDRELKKAWPKVARINELEPKYKALSDAELPQHTAKLKEQVQNGQPLDEVLFDAFALIREGARREIGQRHFDVQLIGGMVLHDGAIADLAVAERLAPALLGVTKVFGPLGTEPRLREAVTTALGRLYAQCQIRRH